MSTYVPVYNSCGSGSNTNLIMSWLTEQMSHITEHTASETQLSISQKKRQNIHGTKAQTFAKVSGICPKKKNCSQEHEKWFHTVKKNDS